MDDPRYIVRPKEMTVATAYAGRIELYDSDGNLLANSDDAGRFEPPLILAPGVYSVKLPDGFSPPETTPLTAPSR